MSQKSRAAPLIGLPVEMDASTGRQYLDRHYADALAAAGGIPILVPLLNDVAIAYNLADALDGVMLTGSSTDVEPARYGARRERVCGLSQPLRDQTDCVLLSAAFERRLPVLAICFGVQSLNVFMGGTLIQDIPSRVQTGILHSQPYDLLAHPVEIAPGSLLEDLAGHTRPMVNSTHHQCLDRIGAGLEVIARAPDGIIEAVTVTGGEQWVLGVQWHPEKSYDYDEFSRKIFDAFISRCRIP